MAEGAPPRRNVAIFLDVENLFGGYEGSVAGVKIGTIVRTIERIVRDQGIGEQTATVRAYANWGHARMAVYQRELLEYGVEPVQVFSFNKNVKNAADIELCVDVLAVAHDLPWVDVFVIVTGDGGFVPLIRRLHTLNKYAIVVSTNAPNAGDVNPLLKSVADEYHQIDVGVPLAEPSTVSIAPVGGAEAKAKIVKVVPPLGELRDTIIKLCKQKPHLLVAGRVQTAVLSPLLRAKWPELTYSTYGSKNLGAFVKKHCGLVPRRPAGKVSTPEGYVAVVRGLFTGGHLGVAVKAQRSHGLGLNRIGTLLKESIAGYSSADAGFTKLHLMLQHALTGTGYHVVQTAEKCMAVIHVDHVQHSVQHSAAAAPTVDRALSVPATLELVGV